MSKFGEIILSLRKEKDYSQDQLAKGLGVSKSSVAMWETGSRLPSPELFEQIADYFNVDIDYLYGRTPIRRKVMYDEVGNEYVPKKLSHCAEEHSYYLNDETAAVAQEMFEKDKVLFDVYRSADKNRLIEYANRLKALRDMEEGNE